MSAPVNRVMFLGLDGGVESVLKVAFDRGLMPNLAAFWNGSARGALYSSDPMVTPVAWTSFAAGCDPADHGIHDFYSLDHSAQLIHHNDSRDVRSQTIWHVLGDSGKSIVCMNLPMTYPAPRVPGIVVSGSDAPGYAAALAQCPEFAQVLRTQTPDYTNAIVWKRRPRRLEELKLHAAENRAIFLAQAKAAILADSHTDWTAMMVHYHNLDSLLHRLWPYLEIDDTAVADGEWNREAASCLRALDDSVGMLLELAERRNAAVIALSDHGFGPCRSLVNVNEVLRRHGFQTPASTASNLRFRAHRFADRFRRWSQRFESGKVRKAPRSIAGQVKCDWKRTAAFAPFGQLCANIYLTGDRRERTGPIERLKREIIEVFRGLRDPETDALLFRDVFDLAERYAMDPEAAGAADVLALSANGYQAQAKWRKTHADRLLAPDFNLPATHYREGIVAIRAPETAPGDRLEADLRDIAPTALALLDEPIPSSMTGRVIHEAFEAPLAVRRDRMFSSTRDHKRARDGELAVR